MVKDRITMIAVSLALAAFGGLATAHPTSTGAVAAHLHAAGQVVSASAARAGDLGRPAPSFARHGDPSRTMLFASRFRRHDQRRFDGFYDWPAWGSDGYDYGPDAGQDEGPPPEPRRWTDEAVGASPAPICPEMWHWSVKSHTAIRQRFC
jgi:hypothetical protein